MIASKAIAHCRCKPLQGLLPAEQPRLFVQVEKLVNAEFLVGARDFGLGRAQPERQHVNQRDGYMVEGPVRPDVMDQPEWLDFVEVIGHDHAIGPLVGKPPLRLRQSLR